MSTYAHLDRLHEDDEDAYIVEEVSLHASERNGDAYVPGLPGLFSVRTDMAREALRRQLQRFLDGLSNSEAARFIQQNLDHGNLKHAFQLVVKVPRAIVQAVREHRGGGEGAASA